MSEVIEECRGSYQAVLDEIAIYTACMDADLMQRVSSIVQGASVISRSITEWPQDLRWAYETDNVDDYVESITDVVSHNYDKLLNAVCDLNAKMGLKCVAGEKDMVSIGEVSLPNQRLMTTALTGVLKWAIDVRAYQT